MAVPISNVVRRVVFAPSGVGPYAFTFEILANTDIEVYKGNTLLTLTTDYTVTINANGTGSVTLVATAGANNITIVGARTIERTTDFVTGGDLFANSLNEELDSLTIFVQQNSESGDRAIKAPVTDPTTIDMTLPVKTSRAGKYLSFNTSTGDPEVVNTVVDVTAVAANAANINTVAGISGNVTTVAGVAANVTTVAGIAANVTTVAGIAANVTTVAGISANVTTVAGISANVTTVATNVADITNFSDVYLGPAATDPATRNDSSPLQAGDLYFNTVDDAVKVYTGSVWVAAYISAAGFVTVADAQTITGVKTFDNGLNTNTISEETSAAGVTVDGVLLKDSQVSTDQINEKTSAAGVTIDGVLLKDSAVSAPDGGTLTKTTATTNAVTQVLRLNSQSSGTPANGIGVGMEFAAETAAGNTEIGATIEAITTDVTATSEDFDLSFKTMAAGAAAAERARIKSTGDFQFNSNYGSVATAYGCRAWVNFDGSANSNLSGTYARTSPSTTLTVTATAHGLIVGSSVNLDFTTGTGLDGVYTVVTVADANTFTVTTVASTTTSGDVTLLRNTIRGSGNVSSITDNGTGNYTVNFAAAMPDTNYATVGSVWNTLDNGSTTPYPIARVAGIDIKGASGISTGSVAVITKSTATDTSPGNVVDFSGVFVSVFR